MTRNTPNKRDENLRELLREWRTDAALPPDFQDQVWRRIESAKQTSICPPSVWAVFAHWIAMKVPRPTFAAAYATILLATGLGAGWAHARQENERVKDTLGNRYVRMLDPYLAPRY